MSVQSFLGLMSYISTRVIKNRYDLLRRYAFIRPIIIVKFGNWVIEFWAI